MTTEQGDRIIAILRAILRVLVRGEIDRLEELAEKLEKGESR